MDYFPLEICFIGNYTYLCNVILKGIYFQRNTTKNKNKNMLI